MLELALGPRGGYHSLFGCGCEREMCRLGAYAILRAPFTWPPRVQIYVGTGKIGWSWKKISGLGCIMCEAVSPSSEKASGEKVTVCIRLQAQHP